MPTCVECGQSVSDLYREFSKGNIRLTQCVGANALASGSGPTFADTPRSSSSHGHRAGG